MIRSIGAVLTGIVVWGVLWVGAGTAMQAAAPDRFTEAGGVNDPAILTVFIAISLVLSLLAGYLCARIALGRVMKHVAILAVIQLAIGIAVQAGAWELMPAWYHVVFLVLVVPGHLLGGRLRAGASGVKGAVRLA